MKALRRQNERDLQAVQSPYGLRCWQSKALFCQHLKPYADSIPDLSEWDLHAAQGEYDTWYVSAIFRHLPEQQHGGGSDLDPSKWICEGRKTNYPAWQSLSARTKPVVSASPVLPEKAEGGKFQFIPSAPTPLTKKRSVASECCTGVTCPPFLPLLH